MCLAHAENVLTSSRNPFAARLSSAERWTPKLRDYALSYVLRHTTRGSIYGLLDVAGVGDRSETMFKADNARLLVASTTPQALAAAWQAWYAGKR